MSLTSMLSLQKLEVPHFFLFCSNKGNDNCCDPICPSVNSVTWACFPSLNVMELPNCFPFLGIKGAQFSVFSCLDLHGCQDLTNWVYLIHVNERNVIPLF